MIIEQRTQDNYKYNYLEASQRMHASLVSSDNEQKERLQKLNELASTSVSKPKARQHKKKS